VKATMQWCVMGLVFMLCPTMTIAAGALATILRAKGRAASRRSGSRGTPAASRRALLFVTPEAQTVRGQGPIAKGIHWFSKRPLLTASTIAAAIAVPVVLVGAESEPHSQ